jgi:hypothetical protein
VDIGKIFGQLLTPLTTATAAGVTVRYTTTIVASVLAILGVLGWLSAEQVETLSKQVPELIGAIAALIAVAIPIYAAWTKSSSDKAAEVAKQIDEKIPPKDTVTVKTPPGQSDIKVAAR